MPPSGQMDGIDSKEQAITYVQRRRAPSGFQTRVSSQYGTQALTRTGMVASPLILWNVSFHSSKETMSRKFVSELFGHVLENMVLRSEETE